MKYRKERLLTNHKQSNSDECLCLDVLELKAQKYSDLYDVAKMRLERQIAKGRDYTKMLGNVMRLGNYRRAIYDCIREIDQAYDILDGMVPIEINGAIYYRLSENNDRKRSCRRKQPHTEEDARWTAEDIKVHRGEDVQAYKCRHCEFWHIGHPPVVEE